MRAEYKHITCFQGYRKPVLSIFPVRIDAAAVDARHGHFVAARYHFKTSILYGGWVNGEVGSNVLDAADVVVRRGIQVRLEAVAAGLLVVDFVFEKEHFLVDQRDISSHSRLHLEHVVMG